MHKTIFLVLFLAGGCVRPNDALELSNPEPDGGHQLEPPTVPAADLANSTVPVMDMDGSQSVVDLMEPKDLTPLDNAHCGPNKNIQCYAGSTCCSGGCADLTNDIRNCGACDNFCGVGWTCNNGVCKF